MRLLDGRLRYSASDLSGFVACRHLTRLDVAVQHGLIDQPHLPYDVGAEDLAARGDRHEKQVLGDFEANGWNVVDLADFGTDYAARAAATATALADSVDGVYQGALTHENRLGLPDFLIRADRLGGIAGYEVVDAKLARSAKALAVLQSTFYSRLLYETTQIEPQHLHLALGGGTRATFRVKDYAAYERQIDRLFRGFLQPAPVHPSADTYPEPVEHCAVCRWRSTCTARRRGDDDLSLIAGITSRQRRALKNVGVATRRGFASISEPPPLDGVSAHSMARAHAQAKLQVAGEDAGECLWELVEPERGRDGVLVPDRGLLALPESAEGDLFFDIEGARYYSEDNKEFGLQYLFGIVDTADIDESGRPRYHAFWSFDRLGERDAFERIVDFITERLDRRPGAHVYHYNHYEPTALDHLSELHLTREEALGRLMGRLSTREDELDSLLTRRVFVDLYRVVRQGIRASVESYSLKRLEPLYGFDRQAALEDVNEQMVRFEIALDEGDASSDGNRQQLIQRYNEDDCRSTLDLRGWLEARRRDLGERVPEPLPRPLPPEIREDTVDDEVRELRAALLTSVPDDIEARTSEQHARALVADLLEYFRRENKPKWWRYFHLKVLNDDELFNERDALAGLTFVGAAGTVRRSSLCRYEYPAQEHGFGDRDKCEDPITGQGWTIHEIDDATGTLTLLRSPQAQHLPHPNALIEPQPQYHKGTHTESIRALARRVIAAGDADWEHNAGFDLLLRRRPNVNDAGEGRLRRPGEASCDAGCRLALALDHSTLAVQGPPGTGKTYTGAWQVLDLVHKRQRRVGVTANSHAVICNLLDEIDREARDAGISIRVGQKPGDDERWVSQAAKAGGRIYKSNTAVREALDAGEVDVVGGTTWVWTNPNLEAALDVLMVDEAGQMSLADVLATCQSTTNLILLGDPMQLAQPSQAAHPPGADISALEHVLGDATTMPDDLGLFIEQTRRMHPDICRFTSEVFYEDRLTGIDGLELQAVLADGVITGSGLRTLDSEHTGNTNLSREEAAVVTTVVGQLLGQKWRDENGAEHRLEEEHILIVTPFNAQIRAIEDALRAAGIAHVSAGTVDKFQGRQAPVVVYSMASSSAEEAPRGMEFLYNLNRLNVATSRAQCLAIVVANPDLIRVFCHTPRQMLLANALCRLDELAD